MRIYLKPSNINWKKIENINGKGREWLNFYLVVWLSAKNVTIVVMEHPPQNINMVIIYVLEEKVTVIDLVFVRKFNMGGN
jgi:hypothetical protein